MAKATLSMAGTPAIEEDSMAVRPSSPLSMALGAIEAYVCNTVNGIVRTIWKHIAHSDSLLFVNETINKMIHH